MRYALITIGFSSGPASAVWSEANVFLVSKQMIGEVPPIGQLPKCGSRPANVKAYLWQRVYDTTHARRICSMTAIAKTYKLRARAAAERSHGTNDPQLRFVWEQIAVSYDDLAKKRLKVIGNQATALDYAGLQDDASNALRASLLNTAMVCHEQAERMRAFALVESDNAKQRIMLSISEHYYLLHDDLLALEQVISRPHPRSGNGAAKPD